MRYIFDYMKWLKFLVDLNLGLHIYLHMFHIKEIRVCCLHILHLHMEMVC